MTAQLVILAAGLLLAAAVPSARAEPGDAAKAGHYAAQARQASNQGDTRLACEMADIAMEFGRGTPRAEETAGLRQRLCGLHQKREQAANEALEREWAESARRSAQERKEWCRNGAPRLRRVMHECAVAGDYRTCLRIRYGDRLDYDELRLPSCS